LFVETSSGVIKKSRFLKKSELLKKRGVVKGDKSTTFAIDDSIKFRNNYWVF